MKFPKALRERLARLAGNPLELAKALPQAFEIRQAATVLAARGSSGSALSVEDRDAMLAKAVAGEYVEIEIDLLSYEQKAGVRNRNSVRFRDGSLMSLGRTGVGTPFLKDHDQWSTEARGGTITKSQTVKRGDGDYAIMQTAKITAPWAVELVLRELLTAVSIGWRPLAPTMCSVCDAPIFTVCWHCPGDTLDADEAKSLKVSPDVVVEWIYGDAELKETSSVPIPGVPNAGVIDVRASLHAYLSEASPDLRAVLAAGVVKFEKENDMDPELLKLLGLTETATPAEVLAATKAKMAEAATTLAELAIMKKELPSLQLQITKLNDDKRKRDEDKFIVDALGTGRIAAGDEPEWRALFETNPDRATTLMTAKAANSVTPVRAPRISEVDPDNGPVITLGESRSRKGQLRKTLAKLTAALSANPEAASFAVNAFGFGDPLNRLGAVPETLSSTGIVNNANLDSARVGFHAAFLEQLELTDDMKGISQLFTEVPSSKKVEQWDWMGDVPDFEEWKNERKLAGLEAFVLAVTNKKWSSGIRIKNDDFKDDALGLLPTQIAALAERAMTHRFTMMVKMLQNGFDGATYPDVGNGLAYDGAFYFSTAHRGGTSGINGSNKLTQVLDGAGLAAAQQLLRQQRTYDGALPYGSNGTHLIVGPQNEDVANKLMTQDYLISPGVGGSSGTTAAQSNYYKGKYKIVVADQLDLVHPLDWFLADLSKPIKPMMFQLREEISTTAMNQPDAHNVFSYDELWFGAQARYNTAYLEFRRIVGSRSA